MGRKLYVGNLSPSTTGASLQQLFERFGTVESVNVIAELKTGRCRGFGFVEMSSDTEARAAIAGLNGTDCEGRALAVNESRHGRSAAGLLKTGGASRPRGPRTS